MEKKFDPHLGLRAIVYVAVVVAFVFGLAGTLGYWQGWLLIGVTSVALVIIFKFWMPDAGQIKERLQPGAGMKGWDKAFLVVYTIASLALFAVPPLDVGRFHWSGEIPLALYAVAYVAYLSGVVWMSWARKVNKFFSSVVRIQKDRGQYVVQEGPYKYMRHPGYAGGILMYPAIAIVLGSYYALIPAAIGLAAIIARAYLEDETLKRELPGYKEYAKKVKYRLVPGIW